MSSFTVTGTLKRKVVKVGLLAFVIFNILFIGGTVFKYSDVSFASMTTPYNWNFGKPKQVPAERPPDYDFGPTVYNVPDKPYDKLNTKEKILHKLNEVASNKDEYWLAHTDLTDYEISINPKEFTKAACQDKATLFYDPRFTFTVVLNEIRRQYLEKNRKNDKNKVEEIVVPFSWSDWVDLTQLNPYIKDQGKGNCGMLMKEFNEPTKDEGYCLNLDQVTDKELAAMQMPSKKFLPGFSVKRSPGTLATNEVRMLEAKSHLLTYAANPVSIMFLTKQGVYEAFVGDKQRLVDSDLFENYLHSRHQEYTGDNDERITLNPVEEFTNLITEIPADLTSGEDMYGMVAAMHQKNETASRSIDIPPEAFDYQQKDIDEQLAMYSELLGKKAAKREEKEEKEVKQDEKENKNIHVDVEQNPNAVAPGKGFVPNTLSRHEQMYYQSLKLANSYVPKEEYTYYKMARLKTDKTNPTDAGWHYEWRFFNGALRYVKDGWTKDETLTREKIVLDRIFRNWFRFASERGILSWIAHGPLLAWYWDGLLFPYDEDIDIQLPAREIVRFAKEYNQTLVVEDVAEGFGKFFIDCSTFLHHRGKSYRDNHIDARFIDIDSGSYIDITGLGVSEEPIPDRYKELNNMVIEQGGIRPVYNCRNVHFYSQHQISPLKLTNLAGVPLYIPNRIDTILKDEYPRGMTWYEYYNFYFVDKLNLWLHVDKMKNVLPKDLDLRNNDDCIREISNMNDEQVLQLLKEDKDILLEYYLTKETTEQHREEMSYLFQNQRGKESHISQLGKQKTFKELDQVNYNKLTSQFKFKKPISRPLFNFEHIDRKKERKKD